MGVYADKLYFCSRKGIFSNRTEYGRKLYVFEDREAHEVAKLSQNDSVFLIAGQSDECIYYWVKNEKIASGIRFAAMICQRMRNK